MLFSCATKCLFVVANDVRMFGDFQGGLVQREMMVGVDQAGSQDLRDGRESRVWMVCLELVVEKVSRVCQALMVDLVRLEWRVTEVCCVIPCFSHCHWKCMSHYSVSQKTMPTSLRTTLVVLVDQSIACVRLSLCIQTIAVELNGPVA